MITPSSGARFLLERSDGAADRPVASARYAASIATPEVTYRAAATLHDDGTVELVDEGPAAPEELRAQLLMFARLTARGAPARRAEGLAQWPARVQRWRPRKDAGQSSSS